MEELEKRNDNRILEKPVDRIKEFPGHEIEVKLQLLTPFFPELIQELKEVITHEGRYQTIPGLDRLFWVFDFDYYGYKEAGEIKMALALIYHFSTPKFWIRKKGEPTPIKVRQGEQSAVALKRSEMNFLVEEPLSLEKRREILKTEQKAVGREIFLVGTVSREKYYFFVENSETTRAYSVSLDLCSCEGQTMSQLEIEYKWVRGQEVPITTSDRLISIELENKFSSELSNLFIKEDLTLLTSSVLESSLGSSFNPTKLTKWEWLLGVCGYDHQKESHEIS